MRIAYLNGDFVRETEAVIPIRDRSFLYGDGLFETLRVYGGVPFAWIEHARRLLQGAQILGIPGLNPGRLEQAAQDLIRRNRASSAVLRVHISRGAGHRGYSTRGTNRPTTLITLHALPKDSRWKAHPVDLRTSSWRIPSDARLAVCKSASKLVHILARDEAEGRGGRAALLLNTRDEVAEADSANFFWIAGGRLWTPPLESGALDGVTRRIVLDLCPTEDIAVGERTLPASEIGRIQSAFLTSSVREIVRVARLDGRRLGSHPSIGRLQRAYRRRVLEGCELSGP